MGPYTFRALPAQEESVVTCDVDRLLPQGQQSASVVLGLDLVVLQSFLYDN